MSIIIQSHHYIINFDNVNYFEASNSIEGLTVFKMNNGNNVIITCPYDEVIAHLRGWTNVAHSPADILIELEYGDDLVGEGDPPDESEYDTNDLVINGSDLANNPPRRPGLQDLDIWTRDQMRDWIRERVYDPFMEYDEAYEKS